MAEYLLLLLSATLVNNFVLAQFLGLCPFMGVSNKVATAAGMAMATAFVMTLTATCTYLVFHWLLLPLGLEYLQTISFILVIAAVVQFTKMFIEKNSPALYQVLGVYLPLITTNCAVLGLALQITTRSYSFIEALVYSLGGALGFALVLILFSAARERLVVADVPAALQGSPIAMITASLVSLAFMGFAGLG